jgi:hypothetical protein
MSHVVRRGALATLFGIGVWLDASAQTQAPPPHPSGAPPVTATSSAASGPAATKHKRASRAKTPPGKPPRGVAECNQGDKAQRQRCINDMYGEGGPRI